MNPAVLIGVGEMGGIFAKALLRAGVPVYPALRNTDLDGLAREVAAPALVLVTVGEADLAASLAALPAPWRDRVGLIQNELLPRDWAVHGIDHPTVAVTWFEKKPGQDFKVVIPTPVAGQNADLLAEALVGIGVAARTIEDGALLRELVSKNLYILVSNVAGLRTGGTVGELWRDHRDLTLGLFSEVLAIQEWLAETTFDGDRLLQDMVMAIEADPDHKTTGRSAPVRLARALDHADQAGIEAPVMRTIGRDAALGV